MSIRPLIYLLPKEVTDFVINSKKSIRIIVPGPSEADKVREHHPREFFEMGIDPETMSNFLKKGLNLVNPDLEVARKSTLIRELASVWNEKYTDKDDLFFQCFKYLTEFRGYTLDPLIFEEIQDKINEEIFEGVFFLWNYLDAAGIVDEQKAYSLIAKSSDLLEGHEYLFWGFSNINSMQIDLIHEIARVSTVHIPFHAYAVKSFKKSDWPLWLVGEDEIGTARDLYFEGNPRGEFNNTVFIDSFNKNRLGEKLNRLDTSTRRTILLPGAEKSFWLTNEFQSGKLNFIEGIPSQEVELNELSRELSRMDYSKDLRQALNESLKNCFSSKNKNFKKIKLVSSAINYLDSWKETTGFDFKNSSIQKKALLEALNLDSPRLNLVIDQDLNSDEKFQTIYDKDLILSSGLCDRLCVVYKKEFTPLKKGEVGHSSEVQSFLATLGPLLNNDFDFETVKSQIKYFLESSKDSIIFLETDVLETDVDLKDFISSLNAEKLREGPPSAKEKPKAEKKDFDFYRPISPSSLQRYIDCPRSYFFHYGEKRRDNLEMKETFLSKFKGTLEHNVIGNYILDNEEYSYEKLESFCREIVSREIVKKGISLEYIALKNLELEILKFSEAGIKFILDLKSELSGWSFSIEKEIKVNDFHGTADLIIENQECFGIFDFKRSSFGIPTKKSVMDFGEIQVPSYVGNYARLTGKKLAFFGYFCLKEPEKSLMFSNEIFLDAINSCGIFRVQKINDDELNNFLFEEDKFENNLIKSIKNENEFLISPSSKDVCNFCHYHLVCPREQI
tara:strand:+ start:838 stop:3201 length:2364 start_codon:yes stop_codon:yes gene_type:complete